MSQLSFSSFDSSLMVRDTQGRYLLATAEQILPLLNSEWMPGRIRLSLSEP